MTLQSMGTVLGIAVFLFALPKASPFSSMPGALLVSSRGKVDPNHANSMIRTVPRVSRWHGLRTVQGSTTSPTEAESRAMELQDWMSTSCGWKSNSLVQIQEVAGKGCGALALQEIREGERALEVPIEACLTANAEHGAGGQGGRFENEVKTAVEGGGEMSALAARLMAERIEGEGGHFWPLVASLPSSIESSVLFWSDAEVELLKGTEAYESSLVMRREVDEGIERMVQAFTPAVDAETVRELARWAYAVVLGYAMVLQKKDCVAVVPYLSYLNHDPLCTSRFQDDPSSVFCAADRVYAASEEVVVNYGHKSNSDLLTSYGFFLSENPHASAQVGLPLDEADKLLGEKTEALAAAGVPADATFLLSASPAPPPLLAALRFLAITDKATLRKEARAEGKVLSGLRLKSDAPAPSLSPANERQAFALLAAACEEAAASLASSAQVEAVTGSNGGRRETLLGFLEEERRVLGSARAAALSKAQKKSKPKRKR